MTAYGPWEAQVRLMASGSPTGAASSASTHRSGGFTPYDLEDQVVVSRSDRFTPDSTFGYQRDYRDPTWVDNRELLVFNYGLSVEQAAFFAPEAGGRPELRPVVQRLRRGADRRR